MTIACSRDLGTKRVATLSSINDFMRSLWTRARTLTRMMCVFGGGQIRQYCESLDSVAWAVPGHMMMLS